MTGVPAVASLTVKIILNAESLNAAEETVKELLRPAENDGRLVVAEVERWEWEPRQWYEGPVVWRTP